jgi:hypothetical protein
VELDGVTVGSQQLGERGVGGAEGIICADVDPDRGAAVGVTGASGGDDVVAGEGRRSTMP